MAHECTALHRNRSPNSINYKMVCTISQADSDPRRDYCKLSVSPKNAAVCAALAASIQPYCTQRSEKEASSCSLAYSVILCIMAAAVCKQGLWHHIIQIDTRQSCKKLLPSGLAVSRSLGYSPQHWLLVQYVHWHLIASTTIRHGVSQSVSQPARN